MPATTPARSPAPFARGRSFAPPPPVEAVQIESIDQVIRRLEGHGRPYDARWLRSVHDFSRRMHGDQMRKSGEPYWIHPLSVAWLLADLKFDQTCVAVALLHDVLEDTEVSRKELAERFGEDVAELVDGVTKIGRHQYVSRDQAQAETFRKLILASARDVRVILVKLADRLHNMQTLEHLEPSSRRRISRETLAIYSPIAHRLGMARVRGDLEDLAFYHLRPRDYAEVHEAVAEKMKLGQDEVDRIRQRMTEILEQANIEAELSFRVKGYYSIYQKLRRQGIDISQLYDYLAFRIVTRTHEDIYKALGLMHQAWRPIPGRFKDYIGMPKPNMYQSLHTTLVGGRGQPFEVQIRTREMDIIAEEGIAAHWRYKEGGAGEEEEGNDNIVWLRALLEWQKEIQDPRTFLTTLKIDLYPDEVYVFTPKGEVLSFPRGATPLDLAYKIHTDLGHHCSGARVNGRLVPLKTELHNGDRVEILTHPGRKPSRDWLGFVATSRAKSKIRHWLNTEQKKRAIEIGRRLLEKEVRRRGASPRKLFEGEAMTAYLKEEGLSALPELLSRVGFGKLEPRAVVERLVPAGEEQAPGGVLRRAVAKMLPRTQSGPIQVKGHDDMLAYLAKCCNPLPGEQIVGYITRGRGVSVHASSCPNVENLLYNEERKIDVEWAQQGDERFRISLSVETEDKPGILAKMADVIAKTDSNIAQLEAETHDTGRGSIHIVVQVRDRRHLARIIRRLRGLPGVIEVGRRRNNAVGEALDEELR
jgi:GTP diphosphokinase / guanosine-3',5'-bis(diphosphate) 3'-diphosphatase